MTDMGRSPSDGRDSLLRGDVTEQTVALRLMKLGVAVARPIGDNQRYDLIADVSGNLHKVQCKTAFEPPSEDSLKVELRNRSYRTDGEIRKSTYEEGEIDVYAVYAPSTEEVYWVPFEEAPKTQMNLNTNDPSELTPPCRAKARFAQDYRLEEKLLPMTDSAD